MDVIVSDPADCSPQFPFVLMAMQQSLRVNPRMLLNMRSTLKVIFGTADKLRKLEKSDLLKSVVRQNSPLTLALRAHKRKMHASAWTCLRCPATCKSAPQETAAFLRTCPFLLLLLKLQSQIHSLHPRAFLFPHLQDCCTM